MRTNLRPSPDPLSIVQPQPRVPPVSVHGDGIPVSQADRFGRSEYSCAAAAVESMDKGSIIKLNFSMINKRVMMF